MPPASDEIAGGKAFPTCADNDALFYTIPRAFASAHLGELLQNFLLIAAGSLILCLLFFRGTLPRFSDRDLFAPVALSAALRVAYAARASAGSRGGFSPGPFAVLLSLALTLPWILGNVRPAP